MKIVREETLISCGKYAVSKEWKKTRKSLYRAIREVDWPRGSGVFTIYPELGKRRGEGNGVTPIKVGLMEELKRQGWKLEQPLDIAILKLPGKLGCGTSYRLRPRCIGVGNGKHFLESPGAEQDGAGATQGCVSLRDFGRAIVGTLQVPHRPYWQYLGA